MCSLFKERFCTQTYKILNIIINSSVSIIYDLINIWFLWHYILESYFWYRGGKIFPDHFSFNDFLEFCQFCFIYLRVMFLCTHKFMISKTPCWDYFFYQEVEAFSSLYLIFILYSIYQHYNTSFLLLILSQVSIFPSSILRFSVCFCFSCSCKLHIIGFKTKLSHLNMTLKNWVVTF